MWKTVCKWLILMALMAYAAIAAAWAYAEVHKARCSGIEVAISGTQSVDTVTSKGVLAELAGYDKDLIGKPVYSINTGNIERFLNGLSHFEEVQCIITSKGKLRIHVRPIVPELRIFDGNKSYYINKDGKHITANAQFFADVPIVSGHFSNEFPATSLIPVAKFIENDKILSQLVTMIVARDPDNILLIPRLNGHVINIGDTTNLQYKKRGIMAAYKKILPYRGWETYDTISVKYHGQIIATRRNKEALIHSRPVVEEIDPEEATLEGLTETDGIKNNRTETNKPRETGAVSSAAPQNKSNKNNE